MADSKDPVQKYLDRTYRGWAVLTGVQANPNPQALKLPKPQPPEPPAAA